MSKWVSVRDLDWNEFELPEMEAEARSLYQTRHTFVTLMLDAGELPGWVQKMMGHESMKMILERYYSYIKNYQRDDGSAFMDNVYNPSVKETDETPDEDEKSENFTPNLHQNEKRELV